MLGLKNSGVSAVYERIPLDFVELYEAQLLRWAGNFRKVGPVCVIRLRRPVGPLLIWRKPRRIVGVRLAADVDRSRPGATRIVIRPQTDADEEAIRRHVVDMRVLN